MRWLATYFIIAAVIQLSIALKSVVVPTRKLNDGNEIPIMALGTWTYTAPPGEPIEAVGQAVTWAIEAGYRHIDTASFYQTEPQVGLGIAKAIANCEVKREDIFVTTKLWNDAHARDQVVPALKKSLKDLNMDYVDLYLIHFPMATTSDNKISLDIDYLETWKGMEDAKSLGLTKSIGVANFNETQIKRLLANCDVTPAVVEIEVNPTYTDIPLVDLYQSNGIQVMAYDPFGFAVFRNDTVGFRPAPQFDDPVLVNLANKYGKTPPQIMMRYLVDRGTIPIPKSTNKCHIYENIDVFDFSLTEDEVDCINKFNINYKVYQKGFDKYWKGFPNYPY